MSRMDTQAPSCVKLSLSSWSSSRIPFQLLRFHQFIYQRTSKNPLSNQRDPFSPLSRVQRSNDSPLRLEHAGTNTSSTSQAIGLARQPRPRRTI